MASSEHSSRRPSNASRLMANDQVPPAPPLPPHFEQARNALRGVFGFSPAATRTSSDQDPASANTSAFRRPDLSSHNASASHRTGLEINALAVNQTGTHVVLAGHEIFKTVRVSAGACTEDANIRAAIRSYDATTTENRSTTARPKDLVVINDVAWAKGAYESYIAAATNNGPIILYDLNRLGAEAARMFDHRRQVHRITCNPNAGHLMLSAGQDGVVRLWDIRDSQRAVRTLRSRGSLPNQNDGIRDVKWSPTNNNEFVFGTDGGWIQKWDTAMLKTAKIKIAAHSSSCSTIDWHPDGKHVMSASIDKAIRVWNMSAEVRRQQHQPVFELKTPFPIRCARWRPSCLSAVPSEEGLRQTTHLVTSYTKPFPVVHIWDVRRPAVPFRELHCYPSAPTDVLWHSQDLLWAVSREGTFLQKDLKFAQKTIDKRNLQTAAVSPLGEVSHFAQQRANHKRSSQCLSRQRSFPLQNTMDQFDENHEAQIQERITRGSTDDSVDGTFLRLVRRPSLLQPISGNGPVQPLTTPTSGAPRSQAEPVVDSILSLIDSTSNKRSSKPAQIAIYGILPGHAASSRLAYLACRYKHRAFASSLILRDFVNIDRPYLKNAEHAQSTSAYRLAQSWRIVAQIVSREVHSRAARNKRVRLITGMTRPLSSSNTQVLLRSRVTRLIAHALKERDSKPGSPNSPPMQPAASSSLVPFETTSNFPTPLARPVGSGVGTLDQMDPLPAASLDTQGSVNGFSLPPSRIPYIFGARPGEIIEQISPSTRTELTTSPSLVSPRTSNRYGSRTSRAQPREILKLDLDLDVGPPEFFKHNSEESFGMFPSFPSSRLESFPESYASSKSQTQIIEGVVPKRAAVTFDTSTGSSQSPVDQHFGQMSGVDFTNFPSHIRTPMQPEKLESSQEQSWSDTTSARTANMHASAPKRTLPGSLESQDSPLLARHNEMSFVSDPSSQSPETASKTNKAALQLQSIAARMDDPTLLSLSDQRTSTDSSGSRQMDLRTVHRDLSKEPFIVSDFMAAYDSNNATSDNMPITMRSMLEALLDYHTQTNVDAQTCSHLLLLILPVLSASHSPTGPQIDKAIHSYVDALLSLDFTERQVVNVITKSLGHIINAGIQPLQVESIFSTYHIQLRACGLETNAAYLRRLVYPAFPSVYEQGLKDNAVSLRCGSCKKPMLFSGNGTMTCENCTIKQSSCPICWARHSPFAVSRQQREDFVDTDDVSPPKDSRETTNSAPLPVPIVETAGDGNDNDSPAIHRDRITETAILYTSCLACNHAAHASCLAAWHTPTRSADSEQPTSASGGTCPTPGCLCQCMQPKPAKQIPPDRERIVAAKGEINRTSSKTPPLASSLSSTATAPATLPAATMASPLSVTDPKTNQSAPTPGPGTAGSASETGLSTSEQSKKSSSGKPPWRAQRAAVPARRSRKSLSS